MALTMGGYGLGSSLPSASAQRRTVSSHWYERFQFMPGRRGALLCVPVSARPRPIRFDREPVARVTGPAALRDALRVATTGKGRHRG